MTEAGDDTKIIIASQSCRYESPKRYMTRANFLFSNMNLTGQRVLDIGCGRGAWALWAGIQGASYILGIEPESDGSTQGTFESFKQSIDRIGLTDRVVAKKARVQDLEGYETFDVIIAYSVINHFSESHTRTFHLPESRNFFLNVFKHIYKLLESDGIFIISDASNRNFFGDIGVYNPFAPATTWEVHQPPEVWAHALSEVGFKTMDIRWEYAFPFTKMTANRFISYFLKSHFVLRVSKA
jgi:cyclopropane fatty-acyl-phospholipid synthase-like methyltransferase